MIRKIITYNDVDTPEEIQKLFQESFDRQELLEGKVCQLSARLEAMTLQAKPVQEPEKEKKGRKGTATIKTLILLLILLFSAFVFAADQWKINYDNVSNPETLTTLLQNRFAQLDSSWLLLTPTNTAPIAAEGKIYYNDTANALELYTGSAWVTIDTATGVSLDSAYNLGSAITVDGDAVILTAPALSNNGVLTLVQSNTGAYECLKITNAGTDPSIEIDNSSTGKDIQGTGDLWDVSYTGIGTFVGVAVGATGITAASDLLIAASTNASITVAGNFSIVSTGNSSTTVELNASTTINGNESRAVGGIASTTIDSQRVDVIGDNASTTISGSREVAILYKDSSTIESHYNQLICGDATTTINGNVGYIVIGIASTTIRGTENKLVVGNSSVTITGDAISVIEGRASTTITSNASITIGGNFGRVLTGNSSDTIHGNASSSIAGNAAYVIAGVSSTTVDSDRNITVGGNATSTITGNAITVIEGRASTTINSDASTTISGNYSLAVGKGSSVTVFGDASTTVFGNASLDVTGNYALTVTGSTTFDDIFYKLVVDSDAAPKTLTARESGGVFVAGEGSGSQTYTLPAAVKGLVYTFIDIGSGTTDSISAARNTADSITAMVGASACCSSITTLGEEFGSFTIIGATSACSTPALKGMWILTSTAGTISAEQGN